MKTKRPVPSRRSRQSGDLAAATVSHQANPLQRASMGRKIARKIRQSKKCRFTSRSRAEYWQASPRRIRHLAPRITFMLRVGAISAMTIVPVQASGFSTTGGESDIGSLLHRVAVFSDDPNSIHDPRHPQPQTGADK